MSIPAVGSCCVGLVVGGLECGLVVCLKTGGAPPGVARIRGTVGSTSR